MTIFLPGESCRAGPRRTGERVGAELLATKLNELFRCGTEEGLLPVTMGVDQAGGLLLD